MERKQQCGCPGKFRNVFFTDVSRKRSKKNENDSIKIESFYIFSGVLIPNKESPVESIIFVPRINPNLA